MKKLHRFLALLLTLVLVIGLLPTSALATAGPISNLTKTATWTDEENAIAEVNLSLHADNVTTEVQTALTTRIVLVMDCSGSMDDGDKLKNAKAAAKTFIQNTLGIQGVQIAIVAFSEDASLVRDFTSNQGQLISAIEGLRADGGTFTQGGIYEARKLLQNVAADNKIMVVLSDGEPNYRYYYTDWRNTNSADAAYGLDTSAFSWVMTGFAYNKEHYWPSNYYGTATVSEALLAKQNNIEIYSVGYGISAQGRGNENARAVMRSIASGSSYYLAADSTTISTAFNSIRTDIITQAAGSGATVVDVMGEGFTVVDGSITVTAPSGVTGQGAVVSTRADGRQIITWTLTGGDFVAGDYALSYRVQLNKSGVTLTNGTASVATNESAVLTYTAVGGGEQSMNFPAPTLDVSSYSVEYYFDGIRDDSKTQTVVAVPGATANLPGNAISLYAGNQYGTGVADKASLQVNSNASRNVFRVDYTSIDYTVTYVAGDHGTFETETHSGQHYNDATPVFAGETAGEAGYSFAGWNPAVSDTVTGSVTYTAQWNRDNYTVTYVAGDHGTFATETYSDLHYNDSTPAFAGETTGEAGYVFAGWNPAVSDTVTGSVTYTAQWNLDNYTVTYVAGDHGTFATETYSDLHYNESTPAFAGETTGEAGYVFAGWNPIVSDTVTGSVTYTAQWNLDNYTVTYVAGDHGTFATETYSDLHYNDSTPAFAGETTGEAGYVFAGWNPTVSDTVTGSVTYTAQWNLDDYTVTYVAGDHGTFATETYSDLHYNDSTPAFAGETTGEAGYVFAGWNPTVSDTVTGSVTYTAQWNQDVYTVTYVAGDHGTFATETYSDLYYNDSTPTFAGATTGEAGYTFAGWNPTVSDTVTGSVTYTAQWNLDDYTVSYIAGDHGTFATETYSEQHYNDSTPAFAGATTGEAGYTFAGWNPTVSDTVTGSVTYTAQWNLDDYNVTYVAGDHGTFATETYSELHYNDSTPTFAGATTGEAGYVFAGWNPTVSDVVTGSVTYTAQWNLDDYTVTYVAGDHGTFATETYSELHYNDSTPAFAGATTGEAGYTFAGWNPTVSDKVTGSVTYTAQWTQDVYTVTYVAGDHGTFATETYSELHYNDSTPAFEGETTGEAGYTFAGWNPTVSDTVTGSVTYTAQWTQNKYTVTYAPGAHGAFDAQVNTDLTYDMNTPSFEGNTTGNLGYSFKGWDKTIAETVTGNVTYTAQWEQDEYTVTFVDENGSTILNTSGKADTYHYGDVVSKPADPTKVADSTNTYAFDRWELVSGSAMDAEGKCTGTVTYKATYTATEIPYYSVYATKVVSGLTTLPEGYTATFELRQNGVTLQTENVTQFTKQDNGNYAADFTFDTAVVAGTYTIIETSATDVSGYGDSASYSYTDYTQANDEGENVSSTSSTVTVGGGNEYDLTCTNTYAQTRIDNPGYVDFGYTVTVNYLDDSTGATLHASYTSGSISTGSSYDVSANTNLDIAGYSISRVVGNPSGASTNNVTVNVYYNADEVIEDEDTPLTDTPEEPVVEEPAEEPAEQPVEQPAEEPLTDIQDEDTALGSTPEEQPAVVPAPELPAAAESTGEVIIISGDTPLGNLPQTGTMTTAVDPTATAGILALAFSMSALGLYFVLTRKKEEEPDEF